MHLLCIYISIYSSSYVSSFRNKITFEKTSWMFRDIFLENDLYHDLRRYFENSLLIFFMFQLFYFILTQMERSPQGSN